MGRTTSCLLPAAAVLGLLFGSVGRAEADQITSLVSTGAGLSEGTTDPNWTYSLPNAAGQTLTGQAVVLSTSNFYNPGFTGPSGNWATSPHANWISTTNTRATLDRLPNGPYTTPITVSYSTTFSLAGFIPSTAVLNLQFTGDDTLIDVSLNGSVVRTYNDHGIWGQLQSLSINSGFVAGLNRLTFRVVNADNNYEGLIAVVSGTANPVPEPSSLVLAVTGGLLGLGALWRHRRRASVARS